MNWQNRLITIYRYVCKHYQQNLWIYSQRMSHYADLSFSDKVMTLFLFGVMDKHRAIKSIDEYADRHLRDGFPRLPRLCGLCSAPESGSRCVCTLISTDSARTGRQEFRAVWLTDSFPVILAGKVAGLTRV
jgi:hypothetical protein